MNVIPLHQFNDCQQEHTIQRASSLEQPHGLSGGEVASADANRHPMLAVFDMIRRSATVAREQNEEDRQKVMHCFALGDMSEPEFFRAMRHLGADDCEIAEFVRFCNGDE